MKLERRRVSVRTPRAQDARRRWPERDSLLVRLTDTDGRSGVGEASPLPGYSPDRLQDIEPALAAVAPSDVEAALAQPSVRAALTAIASLLPVHLPSARMALETAALDLLGQRQQLSAPLLLGALPSAQCSLAQLLGPASSSTLLPDAERELTAGFTHLKLKLGAPDELTRELSGVQALRERYGSRVTLRLDANGALTEPDVARAWQSLAGLDIELFEEPGAIPPALLGSLPLGLDESLQGLGEAAVATLLQRRQARFAVLKPTALGGLTHCWRLAERARALGVQPVLSHCFDGPFAWRATVALALALPAGPAHGLAPHAGLQSWSLSPPPLRQGHLEVWSEPGLGAPAPHGFA